MKIFKLFFPAIILIASSCSNTSDKAPGAPSVTYNASHATNKGDTINRMNEKGKQGRWVYKKVDGTITDTVYKDGIPQDRIKN